MMMRFFGGGIGHMQTVMEDDGPDDEDSEDKSDGDIDTSGPSGNQSDGEESDDEEEDADNEEDEEDEEDDVFGQEDGDDDDFGPTEEEADLVEDLVECNLITIWLNAKSADFLMCGCTSDRDSGLPIQPLLLEVKRIDKIRLPDSGRWRIQSAEGNDLAPGDSASDEHAELTACAFIVRRKMEQTFGSNYPAVTTRLLIRSEWLRAALRDVMKEAPDVSWTAPILQLDPQLILAFLPRLAELAQTASLSSLPGISDGDSTWKKHLRFLIDFLEAEYAVLLQKMRGFVQNGEITFDLLWAVFVPGDVIFTLCETTGEPRALLALRLRETPQAKNWMTDAVTCDLICTYLDTADDPASSGQGLRFALHQIKIPQFEGFHPAAEVEQKLIRRGREWAKLRGVQHRQYDGIGYFKHPPQDGPEEMNAAPLTERVQPHYRCPSANKGIKMGQLLFSLEDDSSTRRPVPVLEGEELPDAVVLLATPIVYGFYLAEKLWLEFSVEHVSSIQWNDEGFKNIAIDPDRKLLIHSLIDSHTVQASEKQPFDDFVAGKGVGLTLAKPLQWRQPASIYGSHLWDAMVLIDEADVFLEERGTADIQRNAIVAVFLRRLEYFRGILFMTTNRFKNFDPAFQSRIHLSLHSGDLSRFAKEHAFLEKTRKIARPVGSSTQGAIAQELEWSADKEHCEAVRCTGGTRGTMCWDNDNSEVLQVEIKDSKTTLLTKRVGETET
ncbi:hypothetical protein B0H10DRAFT_1949311 [Mycena sp. CBHHK59/15]|nr:hypothetical protein B0H10DRAFT_1949311 [Mycena sp. CBHHK59/15]